MNKNSRIFIAGHRGMVGSSIHRALISRGYKNLITVPKSKLNLLSQKDTEDFIESTRPDYIFLVAAKVGGILANNSFRADFIYENLVVQTNVIGAAYQNKVKGLCFFGSSCIYPKDCPQPIKEEYLLSGELEKTNEPYSIAKIAGIKMIESFNEQYNTSYISVIPTNLFGPNDNYDLKTAHALPAMIRKFHEAKKSCAKETSIWGSGKPLREFMYVDNISDACIFLMELGVNHGSYNIGQGEDISILDIARTVKKIVGYKGEIVLDESKPDGTFRKLLDVTKLNNLGWKPKIGFEEGINLTYKDYLSSL